LPFGYFSLKKQLIIEPDIYQTCAVKSNTSRHQSPLVKLVLSLSKEGVREIPPLGVNGLEELDAL